MDRQPTAEGGKGISDHDDDHFSAPESGDPDNQQMTQQLTTETNVVSPDPVPEPSI